MVENVEPTPETSQPAQQPPDIESADQNQLIPQNAKNMALLCHLLGFLTCFIGPLIIWLIEKDKHDYINQQGKEALNFQITMTIGFLICFPLFFVFIGIPLLILLAIIDVVLTIMAAIKANEGIAYRYPFALRLIK